MDTLLKQPAVKKVVVELTDGTVLSANKPFISGVELIDNTEHSDKLYGLKRISLDLKVVFRLFQDDAGNFVWVTKPRGLISRLLRRDK